MMLSILIQSYSAFDTWNEFECKCGARGDILELVKSKLKCTASSQPDCSQHITEYCLKKQSKSTSELKSTSLSEVEKDEPTCTEGKVIIVKWQFLVSK